LLQRPPPGGAAPSLLRKGKQRSSPSFLQSCPPLLCLQNCSKEGAQRGYFVNRLMQPLPINWRAPSSSFGQQQRLQRTYFLPKRDKFFLFFFFIFWPYPCYFLFWLHPFLPSFAGRNEKSRSRTFGSEQGKVRRSRAFLAYEISRGRNENSSVLPLRGCLASPCRTE
jgi:hypothetical protein